MQSIMTDDATMSFANHLAWAKMGQKNHAPKGSTEDPFRGVRHPHRGFGPAFGHLPAETGPLSITARRHL